MTSWLNKQKKQQLLELSAEAGLKQEDDVRKDDLIDNLDKYLQANQTRLVRNASFQPYFDTRRTPFKARSSSAGGVTSDDGEVKSVVKARGRRTTKVKPETDEEEGGIPSPSQALTATVNALTPKVRRRSQLLPPSPADVADDVEVAARQFYSGLVDLWNDTGLTKVAQNVRLRCSSVLGVQATSLAIEAYGIGHAVLPSQPIFALPSVNILGFHTPDAIKIPDLFQLVSPDFWTTTLLWASTTVFIPLLAAYFWNLTVKRSSSHRFVARHDLDPLSFSLAKAVLVWVVYAKRHTFGYINPLHIGAVNVAIPGGYQTMLIGSFVGIIVALYEAIQHK